MLVQGPLAPLETGAYFVIWTSGVFYGIFHVYKACAVFENSEDIYNDFTNGWIIPNRLKDQSDFEWQNLMHYFVLIIPWLLLHLIGTEILKRVRKTVLLQVFHIAISSMFFLTHIIDRYKFLNFILDPIVYFICASFVKSRRLLWVCSLSQLLYMTLVRQYSVGDRFSQSVYVVSIFWCNLRCMSYCWDEMEAKRRLNLLEMLSYVLYLPTLFNGPIIIYRDFATFKKEYERDFKTRCVELVKTLARISFWIFIMELMLHFLYVPAITLHVAYQETFDSWTLYGFGYLMGQFFHIKYVVMYGTSMAFAKFEGVTVPGRPKCIGRIHSYSDMWRYFDEGLYKFLKFYIYIPTQESKLPIKKVLSRLLCFIFIYIWHGIWNVILIWASLNYVVVTIEAVFGDFFRSHADSLRFLSPAWKRRLTALINAPLFAVGIMSNFYFFSCTETGNIFFTHFFTQTCKETLILLFILHAGCHVSMHVRECEKIKKN